MEFCHKILKYPILDKLNAIPQWAFNDWNIDFHSWVAGPNVTQIDPEAFFYCKLDVIDLSHTKITEIQPSTFKSSKVKEVILPEGLKKIGEQSFKNSTVEIVHIPSTVESIGRETFDCNYLREVHLCKNSIEQGKLKITPEDIARIKGKIVWF